MERKLVTILFAAAIGSTFLGDRLDPERLQAVLDAYFAPMAAAEQALEAARMRAAGSSPLARAAAPGTPAALALETAVRTRTSGLLPFSSGLLVRPRCRRNV